ncbi:MAG: hypothetical protein DRI34_13710 [Deltaproteobacteria bacterium]|nr:MAG: hypothetical protein DRI34_13710 [Deltaproteobacteria bacterium]
MTDPRRYLGLHAVSMLRTIMHKWWGLELGLADNLGRPVSPEWGRRDSTSNDFCRGLLEEEGGRRACRRSIRELGRLARRAHPAEASLQHLCHLGFSMVAAPVLASGRYAGCVFCCGFSGREVSRTRILRLREAVKAAGGKQVRLVGERVPVLNRDEVSRMKDLLVAGAQEISNYRSRPPQPLPEQIPPLPAGEVVARSPAMANLMKRLAALARISEPVLLWGPDGCGKRVLARALHRAGPSAQASYLEFSPGQDIHSPEVAFFGRQRGGSLGQLGLLEQARGGTLYLASGSWLEGGFQVRLVRLLREGTFLPVGSSRPVAGDVRLVLGLEQEPARARESGLLREELADILAAQTLRVPAFAERAEDIEQLLQLALHQLAPRLAGQTIPVRVLSLLRRYGWPGNGHEMQAELRSLLATGEPSAWRPGDLSLRIRRAGGLGSQELAESLQQQGNLKQAVEMLEREMIQEGMLRTGGNKSLLARQLGISRSNLLLKLARYGLEGKAKPTRRRPA